MLLIRQVNEELIQMARDFQKEPEKEKELGLNQDELVLRQAEVLSDHWSN